jgi:hypothetical protein
LGWLVQTQSAGSMSPASAFMNRDTPPASENVRNDSQSQFDSNRRSKLKEEKERNTMD